MRPDQRLTPPDLRALRPVERGQERRGLRRLAERGPVAHLDLGARRGQGTVDTRQLGLEGRHGLAPPVDEFHADARELLVPRLEPRGRVVAVRVLLQEPVATREDLAVTNEQR